MSIEAYVIKTLPMREHDRLVVLYSYETGKIGVVAKGALRPTSIQALHIDTGNLIRCELVPSRTGLPIMTGAQAIDCFSGLKAKPRIWAVAQFFHQVVDQIVFDHEPDNKLWSCLEGIMRQLKETGEDEVLSIFRLKQSEMLEVLGYGRVSSAIDDRRLVRTEADDFFERLADRRLRAIDLVYELAG